MFSHMLLLTSGKRFSCEGLDMSSDQFPSQHPKDIAFSTLGMDPRTRCTFVTLALTHLQYVWL